MPQSDPNTASFVQRIMKLAALKQLQAGSPSLYDPIAIDQACIRALGFNNPQQFMAPPSAMGNPPPELVKMQQEGQAKVKEAEAKATIAQAKAFEAQSKAKIETQRLQIDANKPGEMPKGPQPLEEVKARAMMMDAQTRAKAADAKQADIAINAQNQAKERETRHEIETMKLAQQIMLHGSEKHHDREKMAVDAHSDAMERALKAHLAIHEKEGSDGDKD